MSKKDRRQEAPAAFGIDPFAALNLANLPPGPELPEPAAEADAGNALRTRRVILRMERKGRGGKTVTILTGWDAADLDRLPELASTLRRQLGCGGAIYDDTIELQGDIRRRAAEALQRLGIKPGGDLGGVW